MDLRHLPPITEVKHLLGGGQEVFACAQVAAGPEAAVLAFVSTRATNVGGLALPVGTVTLGYFWTGRPYNVYHWLTPEGRTLGHYFNLADRTVIEGERLSWRDLVLDVLLLPGAEPVVLDESELPADLPADLAAAVAAARAQALADARAVAAETTARSRELWTRLARPTS